MKICILSTVALKHMTMISIYTDYLDNNRISYDIIYPDKYHEEEFSNAANIYRFEINISKYILSKIKPFYKFKFFAQKIIVENKYDFIIVWNEMSTLLFADFLKKNFKERYCVNVRDIYEFKNFLINYQLKKAIINAAFTTVSSKKYIHYLPKSQKYIVIHSINKNIMSKVKKIKKYNDALDPIYILYIGNIRFLDHVYKMLDVLGNDNRYIIEFAGQNSNAINDYIKINNIYNVKINGRFAYEKTGEYLQNADIIYNLYGDENINLRTALSNKLYYAVWLNIPILVYKNTYMFEVSNECGIAYGIDKDDFSNLADNLYAWYKNLDRKYIARKCEKFKEEALNSHNELYNELSQYV